MKYLLNEKYILSESSLLMEAKEKLGQLIKEITKTIELALPNELFSNYTNVDKLESEKNKLIELIKTGTSISSTELASQIITYYNATISNTLSSLYGDNWASIWKDFQQAIAKIDASKDRSKLGAKLYKANLDKTIKFIIDELTKIIEDAKNKAALYQQIQQAKNDAIAANTQNLELIKNIDKATRAAYKEKLKNIELKLATLQEVVDKFKTNISEENANNIIDICKTVKPLTEAESNSSATDTSETGDTAESGKEKNINYTWDELKALYKAYAQSQTLENQRALYNFIIGFYTKVMGNATDGLKLYRLGGTLIKKLLSDGLNPETNYYLKFASKYINTFDLTADKFNVVTNAVSTGKLALRVLGNKDNSWIGNYNIIYNTQFYLQSDSTMVKLLDYQKKILDQQESNWPNCLRTAYADFWGAAEPEQHGFFDFFYSFFYIGVYDIDKAKANGAKGSRPALTTDSYTADFVSEQELRDGYLNAFPENVTSKQGKKYAFDPADAGIKDLMKDKDKRIALMSWLTAKYVINDDTKLRALEAKYNLSFDIKLSLTDYSKLNRYFDKINVNKENIDEILDSINNYSAE